MKLNDRDLEQLRTKGISSEIFEEQLKRFRDGFPFIRIDRAATVGDGIKKFTPDELARKIRFYDERKGLRPLKFVPASGAASRMFKDLFSFRENYESGKIGYEDLKSGKEFVPVFDFFKNIEKFAFFNDLKEAMAANGLSLEETLLKRQFDLALKYLLDEAGLNYGALPKGLLKFHRYNGVARTPVEEHMIEGANYCRTGDGTVFIHFTVSPEFTEAFRRCVADSAKLYEDQFNVRYDVSFSVQHPSTDTVAVDMSNEPFRDDDGSILFRPGGHGALLHNLNQLDSDLIFIKNIDNVAPDRLKEPTYTYKKALAGLALEYQERIFGYLRKLDQSPGISGPELDEMLHFTERELCIQKSGSLKTADEKRQFLRNKLNRPIRVCGMVKNQGEPGGGPYWAMNPDGGVSLQIIESSQVNLNDDSQKRLFNNATHFNPVDLVIGVRNYRGEKFDLNKFTDPDAGFISKKSKGGRDLKALELPGLWNGSMSDWNTVFVETPASTFSPVKTVNDLLRSQRQP